MKKALLDEKPESISQEDWDEMREKAVSTIRTCLSDEVVHQVLELKYSKEIWDALEKMYKSKTPSSKLYLKQKLYWFKMTEGTNLVQHINQFNQITGDLGRVGVKVEDEDTLVLSDWQMIEAATLLVWDRSSFGCMMEKSEP